MKTRHVPVSAVDAMPKTVTLRVPSGGTREELLRPAITREEISRAPQIAWRKRKKSDCVLIDVTHIGSFGAFTVYLGPDWLMFKFARVFAITGEAEENRIRILDLRTVLKLEVGQMKLFAEVLLARWLSTPGS